MIEGLEDERSIRARIHRTPLRGFGGTISVIGGLGWDVPDDEYTECGLTNTLPGERRRTNLYYDPARGCRQLDTPQYQTLDGLGFKIPNPMDIVKKKVEASIWDLLLASIRRKLGL